MQIDFAFDKLTDKDFNSLKRMFSFKGLKRLILDEEPYKYYMVRPSQPPSLSYVCFDEPYSESTEENKIWAETKIGENLRRIYKGEGSVQFTAYYPYARAINPVTITYTEGNTGTEVWNPGDLPAELEFTYSLVALSSTLNLRIRNSEGEQLFSINPITPVTGDTHLLINTHTQLLEGLDTDLQKTGNLYNRFIRQGDFPALQPGFSNVISSQQFINAAFVPIYY